MKVAIIGGGSTYSPELADGLARSRSRLGIEELSLFDVDQQRLAIVGDFVKRMVCGIDGALGVSVSERIEDALEGANFVIVQIRVGGQAARREDELIGKSAGIVGQETTGVGGLMKALRTIPAVVEIADRARVLTDDATIINFTNPVSIVTQALFEKTPLKTIGLCNIPISQRREIAAHLGVDPADVEIDSVGLNHLSFIRSVRIKGEEVLDKLISGLAQTLASGARPANIPDLDFPPELIESLQMIPSDYLRYFFMESEVLAEQAEKRLVRAEEVMKIEEDLLAFYADPKNDQKPEALSKRGGAFYSHAALEIIEAASKDEGQRLVVDVKNGDAVKELPPNACVEIPAIVDRTGARPLPQRPLEPEIRGLIQHVKAYEELTIEAAFERSRTKLYLALLTSPLIRDTKLAKTLTETIAKRMGW